MNKLLVLGDSHTRSFSGIDNVYPIFLGNGKIINLSNTEYNNLYIQTLEVLQRVPKDNYKYFFKIGEPNIRYQINQDWNIHSDVNFVYKGIINEKYLSQCIENYLKIIDSLPYYFYIITPTTALSYSLDALEYFNNKLIEVFGDRVINLYSKTISNKKIINKFLGSDNDPIHLNSKIGNLFVKTLYENKIIPNMDCYKVNKLNFNSLELKEAFWQNKFGTLKLK